MSGLKVFERNIYEDEEYWSGVLYLPELMEEEMAEEVLYDDLFVEFENCIEEWWESFVSSDYL